MIGIGTGFEYLLGERSYSLSNYTKGALLYMVCRHVVRPTEAFTQTSECLGFFASPRFRIRVPLAPLCGYPNNKKTKEKMK